MLYLKTATSSASFQRYTFCKEFGWDFYTYERQPTWFIEEMSLVMYHLGKKEEQDAKSAQRTQKRGSRQ